MSKKEALIEKYLERIDTLLQEVWRCDSQKGWNDTSKMLSDLIAEVEKNTLKVAAEKACENVELFNSEYEAIEQSILKSLDDE